MYSFTDTNPDRLHLVMTAGVSYSRVRVSKV